MKFSYNWLRELVPGIDLEPVALDRLITTRTAESDGIVKHNAHLGQVVIGRVLRVEPIAGHAVRKVRVDAGPKLGPRTVVCGASNCLEGMLTAYVPAGTQLPGVRIERATLYGVESDGMLASGAELAINRQQDGILDLSSGTPGDPLPVEQDWILEIDNKSLTHRPDLWGHAGMARELSAILGAPLRDPVDLSRLPGGAPRVEAMVEDATLCPRYSALRVDRVTVRPSPLWLQSRLESVGLNAINNLVDLTNYILAELPQPMHAFDADKLRGAIVVRRAREGEQLLALNQQTYQLTPADLVIADDNGPVAIAGVIGGALSAISLATTSIVLESANFHASTVRRTASRLKLRTDASMRFEKSLDPENTVRGLARAVALLAELCPHAVYPGGVRDLYAQRTELAPIVFELAWMNRKLGKNLEAAEVIGILRALEFGVVESDGRLQVAVPSWRATKDISMPDDLVEEVGRMIGYESIAPVAPLSAAVVPVANPMRSFERSVRATAAARGFTEVHNYSFLSDEQARQFGFDPDSMLAVRNPIASNQNRMRRSLIPNLVDNVRENRKHASAFRLFEIGREIHPQAQGLPEERETLAAALYANDGGEAGLFELKGLAESLLPGVVARPATPRRFEHPARVVELHAGGEIAGRLFELHPDLVEGRVALLELSLASALRLAHEPKRYQPVRRYPSSSFDLSVVTPKRVLAGELERIIAASGGEFVEQVAFVTKYSGQPFAADEQSMSFRVTAASPTRTLTSEEVAGVRGQILDALASQGYRLRA